MVNMTKKEDKKSEESSETKSTKRESSKAEKCTLRKVTDKLYGGINFTWPRLILFAIGAAVLTSIFLIVPIFKDTSFTKMGETLEAWIFLAIIIIANSKKPLESALKTFVFFLISQPLIYLVQVPFTWQGWGIFQYYKFWFILTLCTFPAAYIGWYIKKKNWLSVIILMPMLILLALIAKDGINHVIYEFPHFLLMVVFCIAQILLYLYVFTESVAQKIAGLLAPIVVVAAMLLMPQTVDFSSTQFLPDNPVLTENASIVVDNSDIAEIRVSNPGEDSTIFIHVHAYDKTSFAIKDGDKEYRYDINIYEDSLGISQIDITTKE
jgi:hypothetical protein